MYKHLPQPKWNGSKWVLSVMVDRKRKQFTSSTPKTAGKREVLERAYQWLDEMDGDKTRVFFSEAWAKFLEDYHRRKGDNEQGRQLAKIGAIFLCPALSDIRCGKITIETLQAVINDARPQKRKGQLSRKYLSNIKGCIVQFCRWATPRGYLKTDISGQLYIPQEAEAGSKTILQLSDIERLFSHPVGLWYERALMLEVLTGLRPGEVLGLHREDYSDGVLMIKRSLNDRGEVTKGKNRNAQRVIVCPDEVRDLIETQLRVTESLRSEWLFCNQIGAKPCQQVYRRTWKRLCIAHDLPTSSTPYSLRHTFYSHTEAYIPDRLIKMVFGHSSTTDGHKLYGDHLIDGELIEARDRLSVTPLYKAVK